jgi:hypothetical protein
MTKKKIHYPLLNKVNDIPSDVVDPRIITEEFNINLLDVHSDIGKLDAAAVEYSTKEMIQVSKCDSFQGKSFYLSSAYEWIVGRTTGNKIVLLPINRKYPSVKILENLNQKK